MGKSELTPKQAVFIAGMKGPPGDPAEIAEQFRRYLKQEARIDAVIRNRIFSQPQIKPRPKLAKFIQTYKPNAPAQFEKDALASIFEDVADLADDLNEVVEVLLAFEDALEAQLPAAAKGSTGFVTTRELIDHMSSQRVKIEKTIKETKVPKPSGKPEADLKALYGTASNLLVVCSVLALAVMKAKRKLEERKKQSDAK
jgi:hypothetical protein